MPTSFFVYRKHRGFTLVELLVVIAIIGMLSTIAFISLNRARGKARDAKRMADIQQLLSALELYYNDQSPPAYYLQSFPGLLNGLPSDYVARVPSAPGPPDGVCTDWLNYYLYRSWSDVTKTADGNGWYTLRFCLGAPIGGLQAGCAWLEPSGIINAPCDRNGFSTS